jgi:cullin 1
MKLELHNKTSFEEFLSNNLNADLGIDFKVVVLNNDLWPRYNPINHQVPPQLVCMYFLY